MDLALLFPAATLTAIKAKFAGFAALGSLFVDAWQAGDEGEQLYHAVTQTVEAYSGVNAQAIRGMYLDTATDPGDVDPLNATNATLVLEPGALSALGLSMFFTERPGETYATAAVTLHNASGFAAGPFAAGAFTIAKTSFAAVTYRNAPDPAVYTGPGGTYSIAPGATVTLDFIAESPGSASNADPNQMTLVSQYSGVTITTAGAAIGADRMSAANYRALCRQQATAISPNGHADVYRYLATTNLDGTPLLQSLTTSPAGDGLTAVGIARLYVSSSSATGAVTVYYADDDSGSSSVDVAAANQNIVANAIAVPGCITFTGAAATAVSVIVRYNVKYKALWLGQAISGPTVTAAILAALTARAANYPIGGFDQTAGAGTIVVEEFRGTVHGAHPAIYSTTLVTPAGTTAIALGQVAVVTVNVLSTVTAG